MSTLFEYAVINALTVLPLAAIAFAVSRFVRRPALSHLLWVLVLVKLITPPLFRLPITIELAAMQNDRAAPMQSAEIRSLPATEGQAGPTHADASSALDPAMPQNHVETLKHSRSAQTGKPSPVEPSAPWIIRFQHRLITAWSGPRVQSGIWQVWLVGVASWLVLQTARLIRFQRQVLSKASESLTLQEQTDQLAARIGLNHVPQAIVVDAAVSPMLWGCGSRVRLLFPKGLADRLDDEARATLLMHELAHYVRGDHWIRLLEVVTVGLFWWHPVAWWARQQIEEAEEECCDALVVTRYPHAPRQYAEALLDTIDFLCESRRPLPLAASGLGHAHFLRHRLIKIMQGEATLGLSRNLRAAIVLLAAVLLPWQPFALAFSHAAPSRTDRMRDEAAAVVLPSNHLAAASDSDSHLPSPGAAPDRSDADPARPTRSPPPFSPTRLPGEQVWSTAVSPDGRYVVRTTTARRVLLTDLSNEREFDLSAHRITSVAFVAERPWLVSAAHDGRLTLWDCERGRPLRTLLRHESVLRSVAVSPDGQQVAACGSDGTLLVCDLASEALQHRMEGTGVAANSVRYSPDGRFLAVALGDWTIQAPGSVLLIDAASGVTVANLPCDIAAGALTFASKDELIVGLWDGRTQLWNLANQQIVGWATADKNVVSAATFSPDNPVLREVTFLPAEPPQTSFGRSLIGELFGLPASPTN